MAHSNDARPHRAISPVVQPVMALVLFGFLAVLPWRPSLATDLASASDPAAFVSRFGGTAIAMLSGADGTAETRERAFRDLFTGYFDVQAIGRFVLGPYWRKASDEEREAYGQAFEDFIVATYARRLAGYSGESLKVGPVRPIGKKDVFVASHIRSPEGAEVEVIWRLKPHGETWRIVDLRVSGISMALTRRAEFASVLSQQGGMPGLLQKLRQLTVRARSQA